jgi:hypothetical protein
MDVSLQNRTTLKPFASAFIILLPLTQSLNNFNNFEIILLRVSINLNAIYFLFYFKLF